MRNRIRSSAACRGAPGRRLIASFALLAWAAGAAGAEGLVASSFYRPPQIREVSISSGGSYLAAYARHDEIHALIIRHRETGAKGISIREEEELGAMRWLSDEALLIGKRLFKFYLDAGEVKYDERVFSRRGTLVDPLPNDSDRFLYAPAGRESAVHELSVASIFLAPQRPGHVVEIAELIGRDTRVARLGSDWVHWISDSRGVVRAALTADYGRSTRVRIWYRDGPRSRWRSVRESPLDEFELGLLGFTADGENLLVSSNEGRGTWAVFELDVDTGELGALVFEADRVDISHVVYDHVGGHVIGFLYSEGGIDRYQYLDSFTSRYQRSLEHAFPGKVVELMSTTENQRYFVVLVGDSRDPGSFYLLDTERREASLLAARQPWIDPTELGETVAIEATSSDDLVVESYLTLPTNSEAKPPLVVMPHGGPIGVRDDRSFNPDVQYLAANGFAVLQVNYRGSEGYGKAFLEAGKREFGGKIEDDIDASVAAVVERGLVDGQRMCVVGGSYGGYSALMTVIRHPDLYRCAATIAGPTDLGLLFNSDPYAHVEEGREAIAEIVGDPERDFERLIQNSPVYRVEEIQVPLLIAHGTLDRRVDIEHAYRLRMMLDLYGKPYEWLLMEGAHHSVTLEERGRFFRELWWFLTQHLMPL